jgi:citrate synthase
MDDTRTWDDRRGTIRTTRGGFIMGKDANSHGYSMLNDLIGKRRWFDVMMLHALGRMPSPELAIWLECIYLGLSYPDARIWCNTAGSFGGALRASAVESTCAGLLTSDSLMYGSTTIVEHMLPELEALYARHAAGSSVDEVLEEALEAKRRAGKKPAIPGFSRPLVNGDERVEPIRKIALALGFVPGPYETFVFALDQASRRATGEAMNLAAYHQAFLRDQGFTQEEIIRTGALMISVGTLACYAEARDNPPEAFLPLRCDDIAYEGRPARPLPRRRR